MPSKHHTPHRQPPTRIVRKPVREQVPLPLEKPRTRLAQRRRRFRLIALGLSVLGCLVIVAGVGALSHHSRVSVSDIRVEGARELDTRELADAARSVIDDGAFHVFSRANIFLYPEEGIVSRLSSAFPRIREISVGRESMLSQAVVVTIREREAANTWCDDTCYLMDEDGYVFAPARSVIGYVFRGGLVPGHPIGQHVLRGRLEDVELVLAELARIGLSPVSVSIENEIDYTIRTAAGYDLKLGFDLDTRELVKDFQLLRSEAAFAQSDSIEYVDMRFGNRIYVKTKGEEQREAALQDAVPETAD